MSTPLRCSWQNIYQEAGYVSIDIEHRNGDNSRMDWKPLISEIRAAGLTQADIGIALGKSQVWVADVAAGRYADLKWSDGQALRRLHVEKVIGVDTSERGNA